jgi:hypothetical protein
LIKKPSSVALLFFSLATLPAIATAQQAMTVSGRVTANGRAVAGASVRVPDIRIEAVTGADGRYSFIIPSASVRGQTVAISARSVRLPTVTAQISLRGGSIIQDFDLSPQAGAVTPQRPEEPPSERARNSDAVRAENSVVDGSLSEFLIGRFPGLYGAAARTTAGSATLSYRGPRSIAADGAPIVILNGIELDRTQWRDTPSRLGFGGFDFGQSLDDIDPADVISVRFLTPLETMRDFGSRAGNGALVIETRDGSGINGVQTTLSQKVAFTSPVKLPEFQNDFGQGSGGLFSFFDGKGGGLNDGLPLSWGPALDGRPLTQASLTEAGRPDVRHWLAHPNNVADFFESGMSLTTRGTLSGGGPRGNMSASLVGTTGGGLVPGESFSRYGASVRGSRQLSTALRADVYGAFTLAKASGRPTTGFDLSNPALNLVQTPRQVDLSAIRSPVRDAEGRQINWIYTGSNNPYFVADENNDDSRRHHTFAASATWTAASWLSVFGRLGRDGWTGDRALDIADDWIGGFPTEQGRLGFSAGGFQSQSLDVRTNFGELSATTSEFRVGGLSTSFSAGATRRSHHADRLATVYDSASVGADTMLQRIALTPVEEDYWNHRTSFYGRMHVAIGSALTLSGGGSRDGETMFREGEEVRINPFAIGAFDVGAWRASLVRGLGLDGLSLHAGWGRTSTPLMPNETRQIYAGAQSPDGIALGTTPVVIGAADVTSEVLTSREVGLDLSAANHRLDFGLTVYADRSASVILARPETTSMVATNGGAMTNSGVEIQLGATLSRSERHTWSITANAAHNVNTIVELPAGLGSIPLGPTRWNVRLEGLPGGSVSTIIGSTFLRDASGALLLRNGLPIADVTADGMRALGSAQPDWFGGLTSAFRYRAIDMSVRVDGQAGGKFFSATNRLGATSGTLAETAFRPDSGLLIAGVDSATGAPNTVHVSTESYYRALGDIAERWVYDASYLKLRELRIGATIGLPGAGRFRSPTLHASVFGRNLLTFTRAPNVDPEAAFGTIGVRGLELGSLPVGRTFGIQVAIQP